MSMLSAQCDELRERAATLRQGRWSDGADDARLMEDAAETIWELRDDLQRANAENAKLRELVKDFFDVPCQCLKCEHYNYEEDRCDLHDRARELGIEVDE